MSSIRALAGILYVGEPALPRVLEGLEAQTDVELRTILIGHHPFDQAHEQLYRAFDQRRDDHDVFVKVDADMEVVEPRLFGAIGTLFKMHGGLDLVTVGVDDWISGERIIGMNAWRKGTRWRAAPSALFADLPAVRVRSKLKLLDLPHPVVLHATTPTREQSWRYGAQRGLKVVDTLKLSRLKRMQDFVKFVLSAPQPARLLAVSGAEVAFFDRHLAERLVFGEAALTPSEVAGLEARADDPNVCARTLERLDALASVVTSEGSGSDGRMQTQGRLWRAAERGLRRNHDLTPEAAELLRADFVKFLVPSGAHHPSRSSA